MKRFLFAILILFATATTAPAGAAPVGEPVEFIETLFADVTFINKRDYHKTTAFRTLLEERFAIARIGKFLAGRAWHQTNEETRVAYLAAFKDYILSIWTDRLKSYTGKATIFSRKKLTDGSILIAVIVDLPVNKNMLLGFRISNKNGSYKIIDVSVEGISLLISMRAGFKSVLAKQGIEGLIAVMKKKTNG